MEELATAPPPPVPPRRHRERRHRRKASDAAAAALAASFGDVFGGPPRLAAGAPADYAEVFGGVAASCSIPYLDLPPAAAAGLDGGAGAGGYGEIFGRFDLGEFAVPYDEMLAGPEGVPEEIASISGSSRSSMRKESGQLDTKTSMLYQHYPDASCDQQFDEEQFYPVSFPPNSEQKFSMSYNKTTWGRPADLVEMTTCVVEPSISYVVDSCNLSNDSEINHVPAMDSIMFANGVNGKVSPPHSATSDMKSADSSSLVDHQQHVSLHISENICDKNYNKRSSTCSVSSEEAPSPDPFLRASNISAPAAPIKVQPPPMPPSKLLNKKGSFEIGDSDVNSNSPAASNMKSVDCAPVVGQQQQIPTCLPISENICEDENYGKRSSTHSVSSEEAPSPDYPFLRASNISVPAASIKVQPPPMPPSKFLKKKGSFGNGNSDVNSNSAAAVDAMKEAMEFAEARLKAAKELMERKGDSFKLWKKPAHHRSTKSTEIKDNKTPEEVHLFEEELTMTRLAKRENQTHGRAFLDTDRDGSIVKSVPCDHERTGILSPEKPQEIVENSNNTEQLGKWTSDAEFYELISHDQGLRDNGSPSRENNDCTTNSFTKLDQFEKEKAGVSVGDTRRSRKLWTTSGAPDLRMKHVNLVEDGIASVEVECKAVGDTKRSRKLWTTSGAPDLRMKHVNLVADGIASEEVECEAPRPPKAIFSQEMAPYQEPSDCHLKQSTRVENSVEGYDGDDGKFDFSCMKGTSAKVHGAPEMSHSFSEACISGGHANDNKSHSDCSIEETLLGRKSKDNSYNGLELPCADEILCSAARSQFQQEHSSIPNVDEIRETRVKISESEDPAESWKTYENGKLFSFVNEAFLHNENERANEVTSEVLIDNEMKKIVNEEKAGAHNEETPLAGKSNKGNSNEERHESHFFQEHSNVPYIGNKEAQLNISELEESAESCETYGNERLFSFADEACLQNEKDRANEVTSEGQDDFQAEHKDWDAGSPSKEATVTPGSASANKNEEAEVLNLSLEDMKLMEPSVGTCGTFDIDPYQVQESQGSLGPQDLENRMDIVEDIVSHDGEKEAKECLLENVEKIHVEEVLNHGSKEGRKSMETIIQKGPNDICSKVHVSGDRDGNIFHSVSEVTTDGGSDYVMEMRKRSNSQQASFSEACTSMRCLSQNAEYASVDKAYKVTDIHENTEEDGKGGEFPAKKCTEVAGQKTGSNTEERHGKDSVLNVSCKSFNVESDSVPKFTEDTASDSPKSIEENPAVWETKGRNDVIKAEEETEKEVAVRLDEEKEKMEKEKEHRERLKRELEEEKERERERAKDRLAVRRATKEAHERAFAEARAKAERIALERITSSRQRASADAYEKEGKTTAEAAAEKASREARMKAERAAVERATAEARERAIEKAKAAADAKERMERFRSSFKDSFKATNQDNQQETQFQKPASNNGGKNMDSCIEVVEVESALRHKAKLERHQRTAERAAKALAEKNMRDMLAQREQAERNRLAEFLDPEVKRWSNGKEGNLRALLSTLQYILGSDSGWQSVPLTDLITVGGVKKAYRKATLCVHPDKVQQRGATIRQKYICEKVFDLLKEAWNKFNSEER
ncbi:hypothetical protein ACP4OV_027581 [Aristida adscensionis]